MNRHSHYNVICHQLGRWSCPVRYPWLSVTVTRRSGRRRLPSYKPRSASGGGGNVGRVMALQLSSIGSLAQSMGRLQRIHPLNANDSRLTNSLLACKVTVIGCEVCCTHQYILITDI